MSSGERLPQICVSGREWKVPGPCVTYDEIVGIWNEIHQAENIHIVGTPGIDYENGADGKDGVLFRDGTVAVVDGTSFHVDPEHVS